MNTIEAPPKVRKPAPKLHQLRKSATGVKKPTKYEAALAIIGTPTIMEEIDRMHPKDGNARREALMLASVWREKLKEEPVPKSALILLAAHAYQRTENKFLDQPRKNGTGLERARCSMAKTCFWMIKEGLFVVVA